MDKKELLKMIQDDDLGLLTVKPKVSATASADERLYGSFHEINQFVREAGREPKYGGDIREHQLATRLKSLREDTKKSEPLLEFDEHNLLDVPQKEITSLADIFQDDDLGLLHGTDESLFELKHVEDMRERNDPDLIARRRPCEDFATYESLFRECHAELSRDERKLIPFVESEMTAGNFYVVDGILFLLVKVYDPYRGNSHKINRRTYCIFENGTESNALLRSLGKSLSENGFAVSRKVGEARNTLFDSITDVVGEDVKTGFIYILKSLSQDPRIQSLEHLYKIGFSNIPVEERIRNASQEPTYLMAPVSIVSTFECYNFNPQKLEQLLHNFFGSACLNIDIFDAKQQRHSPREWFIAPFFVIEKAVELIISGGIVNYRYDVNHKKIILRQ